MTSFTAALLIVLPQLDLGGTQPGELTQDIRAPDACSGCHGSYADYAAYDTWSGTMMANAARDPLYLAALTIANQDIPQSGELCIKCHTPRGWLMGRAYPETNQEMLEQHDDEGVQCDFCHRVVPSPQGELGIGNGDFFVADDYIYRGTLSDARAPHMWAYSDYFTKSEFCGLCHDVSNPLQNDFATERTYSEWKQSAFAEENKTCQSCHMPKVEGAYNSNNNNQPMRSVGRHDLVGGNVWMPLVLAGEFPELGRQEAFQYTSDRAREMLQQAADVTITVDSERENGLGLAQLSVGRAESITVRVENLTGHKLPTGYPEGRRCWLEVKLVDASGRVLYHTGAYDHEEGDRIKDDDLHTYEVLLAADGEEGFHFVLTDEVLQDNRIPPRGFQPSPETEPIGREYELQPDGSLAHWDNASFRIDIPEDALLGAATVTATLWYQTTSKEYIEFLRDENVTDNRGIEMYEMWERYDKGPPVEMASVQLDIELTEPPPECGCRSSSPAGSPFPMLLPAMLFMWALSRIRSRRTARATHA